MGQVVHGSATTTEAIRRAIQNNQESLRALAKRYGITQKTVAKWKKRTFVSDLPTGSKAPHSTVLSLEDQAVVVAFRTHEGCLRCFDRASERSEARSCFPSGLFSWPHSCGVRRSRRTPRCLVLAAIVALVAFGNVDAAVRRAVAAHLPVARLRAARGGHNGS